MADRPLTVLIGALGGQGGGVLIDWLVEAAHTLGYPVQATSIPGVAQRTGATTYYVEIFPEQQAAADPIFCPYPSAGMVDVLLTLEPTEAGRALAAGYVSQQTVVISSAARIYSTAEKSVAGDGAVPLEPILQTITAVARRFILIDPTANPALPLNAQMLGALVGCGLLPIPAEVAQSAIQAKGLAVTANVAAFQAGLAMAAQPANGLPSPPPVQYDPPPPPLADELADFPEGLRPLLGHALARLVDYQDEAYARRYLERLRPLLAADRQAADRQAGGAAAGFVLTAEVARPLAAWMGYEDLPRVAQLKTRPGRLARIRAELGARPDEPIQVADYLTPGRDQAANVLPKRWARLFASGESRHGVPVAWPTSTAWGYGTLRLLAGLRRLRPYSHTFAQEQTAIESWLAATVQAAAVDYDLACQTARLSVWARGYGDIRGRGLCRLQAIFANWPERLQQEPDTLHAEVDALLAAARDDPDAPCTP